MTNSEGFGDHNIAAPPGVTLVYEMPDTFLMSSVQCAGECFTEVFRGILKCKLRLSIKIANYPFPIAHYQTLVLDKWKALHLQIGLFFGFHVLSKYYLRRFMESFKNKVVWITGASSGIGAEAAQQLASRGAHLILSARKTDDLNRVKAQIGSRAQVLVLPLDITRTENIDAAVQQAVSWQGKIDLIFNAAGISQRSYLMDTRLEVDRRIMEINYFGTVALTKAVLPHMLEKGGGQFAVITSVTGKFGFGVRSAYAASKHALHGFFESLRIELYRKGIRVTMICPGPVQTDISKNALDGQGKPTGEMDEMQEKGMPVDKAVSEMLKAIAREKKEVVIGRFKEKLGVKLHAVLPDLFFKMAEKQNPRGELKL